MESYSRDIAMLANCYSDRWCHALPHPNLSGAMVMDSEGA
ncbi:hypothetical protein XACS582_13190001 [Xanthomonas citri pv. citri]|nr:hypothetical protein XAC2911_80004 [Xanthomonas citri pv. citri]CEE57559.1 hypothetical protein XACS584_1780001 [Xanthomonas citri pv. citri]CEF21817.1 hypothetical protein XACJK2_1480021 [Xanthomonas citri pv. citri]CEH58258.1 hypothetical protein XACS582_13190001 [Xanthomonas citri pv. citri]CEH77597.1 hypothetical protein XAC3607_200004 [Xanthomonas citri pv. citri]